MTSYVSVVGPGETATTADLAEARHAGRLLARRGYVVVTGGLDGVMAAAAEGVREAGGVALALLPGRDRSAASPGHTLAAPPVSASFATRSSSARPTWCWPSVAAGAR